LPVLGKLTTQFMARAGRCESAVDAANWNRSKVADPEKMRVVLNENERRTLLDLERRVARADPALARSFQNELGGPKSRPRVGPFGRSAITAASVFSALLLLADLHVPQWRASSPPVCCG
jgi:hypothetical protein